MDAGPVLLLAAAALGSGLALGALREEGPRPPAWLPPLHGILGALGLALFWSGLGGHPAAGGWTGFSRLSAGLFALALALGVGIALLGRRGALLALHAGVAIAAVTMLAAVLLGSG